SPRLRRMTTSTTHPSQWRTAKLGDLVDAQPGFAAGQRDSRGVVQLRMNNVTTDGRLDWSSFIRVPEPPDGAYDLAPGDVVFNNTNSAELVGKAALFEGWDERVVYSNHFTRLRAKPGVDARFLVRWLNLKWREGLFAGICNLWIGQAAVSRQKLLGLDVPLPPLEEQRRIAALLDEHFFSIEPAPTAAQQQLEAARALPAA